MSVLINLLPDTRQAQQQDIRRRQMITGIAVGVWAVCGGLLLLLGLYTASQKLVINNITGEINQKKQQLESTDKLLDALTAQQHLAALPGLYNQRAYLTKFFTAYTQANPSEVQLSSLALDASGSLTVNGTGLSYAAIAKLAKALEAVNITIGSGASATNQPYFTSVAIQSANRSNNRISFTLTATLSSEVTRGN